jgi:hypothetical protein
MKAIVILPGDTPGTNLYEYLVREMTNDRLQARVVEVPLDAHSAVLGRAAATTGCALRISVRLARPRPRSRAR